MADEVRLIFNRPPRIRQNLPKGAVEIPNPPEPQFKGTKLDWAILLSPIAVAFLTLVSISLVTLLRPGSSALFMLTTGVMSMGFLATSVLGLLVKISTDRSNKKEYTETLDRREEELR